MFADSGVPLSVLRVDGGTGASDLTMQIQADVLGFLSVHTLASCLLSAILEHCLLLVLCAGFWYCSLTCCASASA